MMNKVLTGHAGRILAVGLLVGDVLAYVTVKPLESGTYEVNELLVEDALSGVAAGRNGEFGMVVGVARDGNDEALKAAGADLVVTGLGELAGEKTSRCE